MYMPQLHFSVDEPTAKRLIAEAQRRGITVSKYLAGLVAAGQPDAWPADYLASVVGALADEPLDLPAELPLDDVDLDGP
jgi:hypothetical protein